MKGKAVDLSVALRERFSLEVAKVLRAKVLPNKADCYKTKMSDEPFVFARSVRRMHSDSVSQTKARAESSFECLSCRATSQPDFR